MVEILELEEELNDAPHMGLSLFSSSVEKNKTTTTTVGSDDDAVSISSTRSVRTTITITTTKSSNSSNSNGHLNNCKESCQTSATCSISRNSSLDSFGSDSSKGSNRSNQNNDRESVYENAPSGSRRHKPQDHHSNYHRAFLPIVTHNNSNKTKKKNPPTTGDMNFNNANRQHNKDEQIAAIAECVFQYLERAITSLQARTRGFLARASFHKCIGAIIIQAFSRRFLCQLSFHDHLYAATTIQAASRGMSCRQNLSTRQHCAIEIQRCIRGFLACSRVYYAIYGAIIIQSFVRRRLVQKKIIRVPTKRTCAIVIQKHVRGYLATLNVYADIYRIMVIQSYTRQIIARRLAQKRKYSIILLQSMVRKFLARCRMRNLLAGQAAAVLLKPSQNSSLKRKLRYRKVRLQSMRKRFAHEYEKSMAIQDYRDKSAMTIQKIMRGFLLRMRLADRNKRAATVIQKHVRGYQSALYVYKQIYQITLIQNHVRRKIAEQQAMERYKSIVLIQSAIRRWLVNEYLSSAWLVNTIDYDEIIQKQQQQQQNKTDNWILNNKYAPTKTKMYNDSEQGYADDYYKREYISYILENDEDDIDFEESLCAFDLPNIF